MYFVHTVYYVLLIYSTTNVPISGYHALSVVVLVPVLKKIVLFIEASKRGTKYAARNDFRECITPALHKTQPLRYSS